MQQIKFLWGKMKGYRWRLILALLGSVVFSILSLSFSTLSQRIVDEVIAYIKSTGLSYYVGPFETTIEGDDYDQLMDIVKECQHVAIRAGCPGVSAYIKVSYKPEGGVMTIDQKVTKHHQ